MRIFGNKICPVCHELNTKSRKECTRCSCTLKNTIVNTQSKTQFRTREQLKENRYIFTFSEVN